MCSRRGCATRSGWRSIPRPASCGPTTTIGMPRGRPAAGTPEYSRRRQVVRVAAVLSSPEAQPGVFGSRLLGGGAAGDHRPGALGAARPRVLYRHDVSDGVSRDAFMTYHGSWDRTVPTGAKVVRVRVANGRPTAVQDFVTGWQLADGSRWGRPVGVLVLPDGSLLVSDDEEGVSGGDGGRVWRVSYGK